jgi:hypothetical protein
VCLRLAGILDWPGLDCSTCPVVEIQPPTFRVTSEIARSRIEDSTTELSILTPVTETREGPMKSIYEKLPAKARQLIQRAIDDPSIRAVDLYSDLLKVGISPESLKSKSNLRQYLIRRGRATKSPRRRRSHAAGCNCLKCRPIGETRPEVLDDRPESATKKAISISALERVEETRTIERVEFGDAPVIVVLPNGRCLTTDVGTAARLAREMSKGRRDAELD